MKKKKKLQPPFQKAVLCKPENVPLCSSGRIDLAIPENRIIYDFLKGYSGTYNSLLHWTFRQVMNQTFRTEGELKKTIMKKGGLKARAANAILREAKTEYHSAIEIKNSQIEDHNQKIRELTEEIKDLEIKKEELNSEVENWSRPPKKAVKKLHRIKAKLWSRKNRLHRYRQTLRRLEKEVQTGKFSYCFGSRKLARQQWTLEYPNSPFSTHRQWLKAWRDHRSRHTYFLGSSDETCGCQLIQGTWTGSGDLFEFRVRSPFAGDQSTIAFTVRIPWQSDLIDWHQKNSSISYVFVFRKNGSLYIHPQIEEEARDAAETKGCLGMDINAGFLAVAEIDELGNYIQSEDIYYDDFSLDADTAMKQILAGIYKRAKEKSLSIAIEDVSFKKKKAKNHGKRMNHILHDFPYRKYREYNERKASRSGVPLHIVSAAYTSRIGKEKYMEKLGISGHQAAAYVIGRRALGFREVFVSEKKKINRNHIPDYQTAVITAV